MIMLDADSQFKIESQISVPGISVEIGEFGWNGPPETVFYPSATHKICMMLSASRPPIFSGHYFLDSICSECTDIGRITFAPAGTKMFHRRSAGNPQRIIQCSFDVKRFQATTELDNDWGQKELKACLDIRWTRLVEILMGLAREMEIPGFGSSIMVEACAVGVMVEVGRYLRDSRNREESTYGTLASWQLRRIDQYVHELEGRSPTISDLAEQCGVSRSHLTRLFKATTGQTVHNYVAIVRVKRAKALLSDTNLSLKQISYRLGFSHAPAFSLAFRKAVGEAPRSFRQKVRRQRRSLNA